eukprot:scaffold259021_cov15-Prasinocladus_malaysianus.AAC.1
MKQQSSIGREMILRGFAMCLYLLLETLHVKMLSTIYMVSRASTGSDSNSAIQTAADRDKATEY